MLDFEVDDELVPASGAPVLEAPQPSTSTSALDETERKPIFERVIKEASQWASSARSLSLAVQTLPWRERARVWKAGRPRPACHRSAMGA